MTTLCVFNTNELTANWFSHLPLCSLPIQLYLVDSFFYAASATSAAAVSYSSIFFFFGRQLTNSALSIALWLRFPIIWSTNVRQTWARRWKFRTFFVSFNCFLRPSLKRLEKQLLAGIAIVIGIPFPIWIYYKGEELRARNPLTRMSTIPKRISWRSSIVSLRPRYYTPLRYAFINDDRE